MAIKKTVRAKSSKISQAKKSASKSLSAITKQIPKPSKTKSEKKPARRFDLVSETTRRSITKAIDNILAFGDTDVLPRSFELRVVKDMRTEVEDLVADIYIDYPSFLEKMPVVNDVVLSPVGYTGFRSVSQLDPIWNIYLLSLVIAVASAIEGVRIPADKNNVHSFRFDGLTDSARVFSASYGWQTFVKINLDRAKSSSYVLITDISDFYPRIYHHRLENALKKVCKGSDLVPKIVKILSEVSGGVSYGLPVGGPASRLLAELLLNATDRKLLADGLNFTRFVDDFRIFSDSKESAHGALINLAEFLGINEGLSLQKNKTKVLSSEEFINISSPLPDEIKPGKQASIRDFVQLKIHFDPYSETAQDDYEELRRLVQSFDIVGILAAEMRKSQIDEGLVKKLVKSVRHLDKKRRDVCIRALAENIELLAPVFQVVMHTFLSLVDDLDSVIKTVFVSAVKNLFAKKSHVILIPANQSWAIRVLEKDFDDESEQILNSLYQGANSLGVRRDVIIAMANGDCSWFISSVRKKFNILNAWERRAVICSSYMLEDEGAHWRKKLNLTGFEKIVQKWAANLKNKSTDHMRIPL